MLFNVPLFVFIERSNHVNLCFYTFSNKCVKGNCEIVCIVFSDSLTFTFRPMQIDELLC